MGLLLSLAFVVWPAYRAQSAAPRIFVWGGLFVISCEMVVMGIGLLLFGRRMLGLLAVQDTNNISWQQALALAVLALIALAGFVLFSVILGRLGYHRAF